ncbi:MAG: Lrp/AsnC family transcriptional regulator [Hyphomicrobiaceae bacterium]
MSLDEFDLKLLDALQLDGRLTNQELAEHVGLSASQCSRRRSALEHSGIISSYHAVLSDDALGLELTVIVHVSLAMHSPENAGRLGELLIDMDEVLEVFSLTGEADYMVKLVVPDLARLSQILNDVLLPHEGVARLRSSIVLDRLKHTTQLPLRHLS